MKDKSATTSPENLMSVEAYLEFERASELRHEYYKGKVSEITGGNTKHSLILVSTLAALHGQLRKRPYDLYPNLMRLKTSSTLYTYPDIAVVFGESQLEDEFEDTLLNPTLIIEVLSPSTENYDRGKKFQHYRTLTSLQEYVLIAQDSPRIERYVRQSNDEWLFSDAVGMEAALELTSIQCQLALADVYEKVTFEDQEA